MGDRVFKRGRIYYAWIPQPEGGLRKVSTRCTDKKAALSVAARLEREAVDPAHAAAHRATVQKIVDDYARSRLRLGRSAGTMHHYAVKLGNILRLGPRRARDLTHARMLDYVDARLSEGTQRTTIKKELRALKAALWLARRNKVFTSDPEDVIPELEDDYVPRDRFLDPWELVALCTALPFERAARVAWIVAVGARWGESDRAAWGDRRGSLQRLRGTKTKASARVVPIIGASVPVLAWAERQILPSAVVFGAVMFERWLNVRRDLILACEKIGIVPVSPNDLRRTFSKWLRMGITTGHGVAPSLIGAAMGHTDSRMVERVYGRLAPDDLRRQLMEQSSGMNVVGTGVEARPSATTMAESEALFMPDIAVPRDGIEPPTRGFSSPFVSGHSSQNEPDSDDGGMHVGTNPPPDHIPESDRGGAR